MKRIPLALLIALVTTLPSVAQDADESALDQFDQTKAAPPAYDSPASVELRDAVRRMAARPNDPVALADAGHASLKLGDAAAALNFFNRANSLQPGNARTLSGLGSAMVRNENPFEALRYFDEAVRLGASERSIALDRALAFDLLGNFDRAHKDYQLAKSYNANDEFTRRYAMSLSMAGKASEADSLLLPLLQRNDAEAWRARSMMLAARGEVKEAVQIAQGFLSADAARRMEGFFRQMPRMTDAQRAAAMHFGHFPVGRIGEDTPEIRRVAAANPQPRGVSAATGQDRLIPAGTPLGGADKKATQKKDEKKQKTGDARLAKAEPRPGFSTTSAQQKVEQAAKAKPVVLVAANLPPPDTARGPVKMILPAATSPAPVTVAAVKEEAKAAARPVADPMIASPPVPRGATGNIAAAVIDKPAAASLPATSQQPTAGPGPNVSSAAENAPVPVSAENQLQVAAVDKDITAQQPSTSAPAAPQGPLPDGGSLSPPVPQAAVAAPATPAKQTAAPTSFDLEEIVRSIEIPESEQQQAVAAVDLKAIQRAQAKADAEAAAREKAKGDLKKSAEPARIWVQIATGAEAALGNDYRRLARKSPDLFKGKEGWTASWGKSSRLLVGPFADSKSAKKWEADFRKDGGNGFVWQSENGTLVKKLGAK